MLLQIEEEVAAEDTEKRGTTQSNKDGIERKAFAEFEIEGVEDRTGYSPGRGITGQLKIVIQKS